MTRKLEIYRCDCCTTMIEVLRGGDCEPSCCGKPMELVAENTVDASTEKHVPVVERIPGGFRVKVGSVPHPMLEAHYIEWIALRADGTVHRRFLSPGQKPEAEFHLEAEKVTAHEFCNLHGLWKD